MLRPLFDLGLFLLLLFWLRGRLSTRLGRRKRLSLLETTKGFLGGWFWSGDIDFNLLDRGFALLRWGLLRSLFDVFGYRFWSNY
jgi:hypothetical protein